MLTFCTFSRVIKESFSKRIKLEDFVNLILAAVPIKGEAYTVNHSIATGLFNGRKQVPSVIQDSLRNTNNEEIADYFRNTIIPCIDERKLQSTAKGIIELTENDDYVLEQDRELMGEYLSADKLPELFSVGFITVILAENGNPDMYLHKAPPLSEWIDMPDFLLT